LLFRALTAVELRKKLLSKGFSPNAVEAVINKLQRQYVANFIYRNCWAIVYQ
jgi:SOS response regulatory protein OraA/RecX